MVQLLTWAVWEVQTISFGKKLIFNYCRRVLEIAALSVPIFCIVVYAIAVFIHFLPPNPLTKNYKYLVYDLMTIRYPSSWQFFAPTPVRSSVKILAKCKGEKNEWSSWFDIYEDSLEYGELISATYARIASHMHRSIENVLKTCRKEKIKELSCLQKEKKTIERFRQTQNALFVVEKYCRDKFNMEKGFQYKLIHIHPVNYANRKSSKKFERIEIIYKGKHTRP